MEVVVDLAGRADIVELREIARAFHAETPGVEEADWNIVLARFGHAIDARTAFVARDEDGAIVGALICEVRPVRWFAHAEVLGDLMFYVLPIARGHAIDDELIDAAHTVAKNGLKIPLEIASSAGAKEKVVRRFFERRGFTYRASLFRLE